MSDLPTDTELLDALLLKEFGPWTREQVAHFVTCRACCIGYDGIELCPSFPCEHLPHQTEPSTHWVVSGVLWCSACHRTVRK